MKILKIAAAPTPQTLLLIKYLNTLEKLIAKSEIVKWMIYVKTNLLKSLPNGMVS